MRPTVHDIAASAGVSLATVDRVLNNRPGVREDTRRRVEETIEQIGFVRNMAAANLAKGKQYGFDFLVPDNDNSFMRLLREAVEQSAAAFAHERMAIRLTSVPAFDAEALVEALRRISARGTDGVALVGVDAPIVRAMVGGLMGDGIPVVTLVSDLQHAARIHFSGINNVAAGRTAASLLGRFVGHSGGKVGVLAGSMMARDHRERLDGFQAVMEEGFPSVEILPVVEGRDNADIAAEVVGRLFREHPDIRGLYSLGAGNRGLLRVLERQGLAQEFPVVVHELTSSTRNALKKGLVTAVLHQDAGHEVRSAIRVLRGHVDGMKTLDAQERIRIEIYLKDNLPEEA